MADFASILNKPASSIEKPKPLPTGTYLCLVSGVPNFTKVGDKQTDAVDFNCQILQPQEDVDSVALNEQGGFAGKSIRVRHFLTEDAAWRCKEFLIDHLGIEEAGKSLGQLISEAPSHQVLVNLRHKASQDGKSVFAEVANTARV